MKKTKISLMAISALLTLIAVFATSCEKEKLQTNNQIQQQEKQLELESLTYQDMPELKVYEGMLCFESEEQFEKVISILSNMTEQELDEWEQKVGFTSLRTKYNNAYDELDNAISVQNKNDLIAKHSDLFKLEKFGDDIRIVEKNISTSYKYISNTRRMFLVNDKAYKTIDNYLLETDKNNFDILINRNDINNLPQCVKTNKIFLYSEDILNPITKGSSSNQYQYTYYDNAYHAYGYFINIDTKRACYLKIDNCPFTLGGSYYELKTWGEKKYLGSYHRYKTNLGLKRIKVVVEGHTYGYKHYSATNSREIWKQYFYTPQSNCCNDKPFTTYYVKATSRGYRQLLGYF